VEIIIETTKDQEIIDINKDVQNAVDALGVRDGLCHVFVQHTTAAITINENNDPNVGHDFIQGLEGLFPKNASYKHHCVDGNAHAHIKAAIVGPSETILVRDGALVLGRWQDIFLCEFDGPRSRIVNVEVLEKK